MNIINLVCFVDKSFAIQVDHITLTELMYIESRPHKILEKEITSIKVV